MSKHRIQFCVALLATLAGCAHQAPDPEQPGVTQDAPDEADTGTCWSKAVSPAIIETVTHQVLLRSAELQADGMILRPAAYKTESRQEIVRERRESWFQTLCETEMTEDFVASLQRALAARHLFSGPVTGQMDAGTGDAVRKFQAPNGIDSSVLSLAAARQLGLIVVDDPGEI